MNSKAKYYQGFGVLFFIAGIALIIMGIPGLNSNDYIYPAMKLGGGIILLLVGLILHHYPVHKAKVIAKQRAIQEYIDSIAPADMVSYTSVNIDPKDVTNDFGEGDHPIKYMFINKDKAVTFPESKVGNAQKYYIINIDFTPKYHQTISGNSQSFGTNYGSTNSNIFNQNNGYNNDNFSTNTVTNAFNRGTFNGDVNQYEVPTDAFMTLVSTKLDRSFTIHLIGEKQKHIQELKQYFMLNAFEQKQVGIK